MHVQGQDRYQATLFPERLDELIGEDNPVRVIDAFVDSLQLKALGFARIEANATGRPPYHPGDLLKLYVYGYMHRIRSCRALERECHTNLEVLWLLNRLAPDHKTIANFRVDNRVALTRVCRAFVQFCRSQSLYGGETIAIDGSKFGADNNRGKVTRRQELKQQLQRLDTQISSWLDELADNDDDDEPPSGGGNTRAALQALKAERATLTERIEAMDEAGVNAQPDTDPEARVMRHGQVGYNVQSTVDGKHCLIVDVDVVQNANDQEQLYRMARRTQRQLQEQRITVLADAGYSNGQLLKRCQAHGLIAYVPVNRAINNQGDGKLFDKSAFTYHAEGDYYQCPAGQRLAKKTKSTAKRLYLYTNAACQDCHVREHCTTAGQRWVTRHFEEDVLDAVADRTAANPLMMQRRKGMVEHPFGTLKRRMDGGRFLLRGLQKVKAEMALAVTAYNLTRAINVLGTRQLCQALAA
ncbi:MAG: IS1182 family transposase [Betaproteobacteria bacterium]|nr:MAG: IS1182 family transposase [Betaproteobacteria bacterium]